MRHVPTHFAGQTIVSCTDSRPPFSKRNSNWREHGGSHHDVHDVSLLDVGLMSFCGSASPDGHPDPRVFANADDGRGYVATLTSARQFTP